MALVDPFIPQPPEEERPHKRAAYIRPRSATSKPRFARVHKKNFTPPDDSKPGRVKRGLQMVIIVLLSVALGFSVNILAVGEIAIGFYAVCALLLRFSSRTSFSLALAAFAMIILLEILQPAGGSASNFAVYAFLLLVVGTLSLGREVHQEAKWEKWRRPSSRK